MRSGKVRWIVVKMQSGVPVAYCGHGHLSDESADKCAARWHRWSSWPRSALHVVASVGGR